jgi:hypothetical protein
MAPSNLRSYLTGATELTSRGLVIQEEHEALCAGDPRNSTLLRKPVNTGPPLLRVTFHDPSLLERVALRFTVRYTINHAQVCSGIGTRAITPISYGGVCRSIKNKFWEELVAYMPNTVIWGDLQTPTAKEGIRRYSSPQHRPKRPSREPHGATRQQAIAKTPSKWSVHQIPIVIVVFVDMLCTVWFVSLIPQHHKSLWTY